MKTQVLPSWYATNTHNHQGVVACEKTGRTVAVTYDKADAALIAAAPTLLYALKLAEARIIELSPKGYLAPERWDIRQAINEAEGRG